jgi:hypothetical protein
MRRSIGFHRLALSEGVHRWGREGDPVHNERGSNVRGFTEDRSSRQPAGREEAGLAGCQLDGIGQSWPQVIPGSPSTCQEIVSQCPRWIPSFSPFNSSTSR